MIMTDTEKHPNYWTQENQTNSGNEARLSYNIKNQVQEWTRDETCKHLTQVCYRL